MIKIPLEHTVMHHNLKLLFIRISDKLSLKKKYACLSSKSHSIIQTDTTSSIVKGDIYIDKKDKGVQWMNKGKKIRTLKNYDFNLKPNNLM